VETSCKVDGRLPRPSRGRRPLCLDRLHGAGADTERGGDLPDAEVALLQRLSAVDRAENDLIPALAAYEREMVAYGFRAVRESLRNMERFHTQGSHARLHQIALPRH
jgi:hypothetical protein